MKKEGIILYFLGLFFLTSQSPVTKVGAHYTRPFLYFLDPITKTFLACICLDDSDVKYKFLQIFTCAYVNLFLWQSNNKSTVAVHISKMFPQHPVTLNTYEY